MVSVDVDTIHAAASDLGFLGSIVVRDSRVWAVGGTYHKPTCLYSGDGGHSFVRWTTPQTPGLRDVHIEDETVWVVGEYGTIAKTTDGATWKVTKIEGATGCLYAIERDAQGRLWILGDDGLVLRSRTGRRFQRIPNHSSTRLLNVFVESTCVWILDSGGMLQRSRGPSGGDRSGGTLAGANPAGGSKSFAEIPVLAMRAKRPLTCIERTPARTLLLTGDGGLVLRSTNDGVSWKKIAIDVRADLEKIFITRYGIFVIGDRGTLLVSHDDGRTFAMVESAMQGHLWSIAAVGSDLLVGGEQGVIYRLPRAELALVLRAAYEHRDPVLADLASRMRDGDEGAELVLEDALRERGLW